MCLILLFSSGWVLFGVVNCLNLVDFREGVVGALYIVWNWIMLCCDV